MVARHNHTTYWICTTMMIDRITLAGRWCESPPRMMNKRLAEGLRVAG